MLNFKKIRLMTKLAVYEKKDGKEDIHLSKYYKTDYVRFQTLKSIITATIGYALILALIAFYRLEYLIKNAVVLDYKLIGTYVLGFYLMTITLYGLGSIAGYSMKYDASRKKLSRYFKLLKGSKRYTMSLPMSLRFGGIDDVAITELRERVKNFYQRYDAYLLPIIKFIFAFIAFQTINKEIGYDERLKALPIVLGISLLCIHAFGCHGTSCSVISVLTYILYP